MQRVDGEQRPLCDPYLQEARWTLECGAVVARQALRHRRPARLEVPKTPFPFPFFVSVEDVWNGGQLNEVCELANKLLLADDNNDVRSDKETSV